MNKRMELRVFVAEDEPYPRKLLINYILGRPELKMEDFAENGDEALEKIRSNNYDLLFIDINMPVLSGIEIVERLDHVPYIIFTTAYDRFAIKAFELGALDYILKPFDKNRFDKAVDRALSLIGKNQVTAESVQRIGLSCREGENFFLIPFEDIIYLSSHTKHTVLHTKAKSIKITGLLKDLALRLPESLFMRIHKQYIVNMDYISLYKYFNGGQYILFLNDDEQTTLPMGRKYFDKLKDKFP